MDKRKTFDDEKFLIKVFDQSYRGKWQQVNTKTEEVFLMIFNNTIKIDGEHPGSPENPKMLKKFIYCTGITTIIFIIIYLLMKFEYLNLRNIIT